MLGKDELVRIVAQSCGVSVEVSSFFFEVFVNRLSNKLKPGDLLHFHNNGFFHKRNCRIQIEKTSDSPTPKSYLIQLVLFSSSSKVRSDLGDIHFLKIANLKTLWLDDKDFQKSLNAGDFAPYSDRNQLIKSFATKAEVIISGLRKDYDSELVEELTIPLTFDLNFLVKRGQKGSPGNGRSDSKYKSKEKKSESEKKEPTQSDEIGPKPVDKETTEDGLPWNYGTKFLDKDKSGSPEDTLASNKRDLINERKSLDNQDRDSRKEQATRLRDFEPVTSHRISPKENTPANEGGTLKFNVKQPKESETRKSDSSNKFTEVKSKSESYSTRGEFRKNKKYDKHSLSKFPKERAFTDRRNYLPIVAIAAFVIIVLIAVYIYFIKGNSPGSAVDINFTAVKPPSNVNLIERDYDFAVSFPYPELENKVELSGFNRDLLFAGNIQPEVKKESKPVIKPEQKDEIKSETVTEVKQNPVIEKKPEPPVVEEKTPVTKTVKAENSRIFLYRGFYVVYIGTYKSEEVADREADKYFDLGYNAIVEVVENRGRGREYKLSIGDFTSEEFARQFQEKYLK